MNLTKRVLQKGCDIGDLCITKWGYVVHITLNGKKTICNQPIQDLIPRASVIEPGCNYCWFGIK